MESGKGRERGGRGHAATSGVSSGTGGSSAPASQHAADPTCRRRHRLGHPVAGCTHHAWPRGRCCVGRGRNAVRMRCGVRSDGCGEGVVRAWQGRVVRGAGRVRGAARLRRSRAASCVRGAARGSAPRQSTATPRCSARTAVSTTSCTPETPGGRRVRWCGEQFLHEPARLGVRAGVRVRWPMEYLRGCAPRLRLGVGPVRARVEARANVLAGEGRC